MADDDLTQRVHALRGEGRAPKEIARALGVRPAVVAPIVRAIAREEAADAPEPAVVGCWVSPGWSAGLGVEKGPRWPDRPGSGGEESGLAGVMLAREHRRGADRVSVCGWLVDTYCLGVKDALGPRTRDRAKLRGVVDGFFRAFDDEPLEAPIELARALVWGAIDYARGLGFAPARDFAPTADHLGPPSSPVGITFGYNGRPLYIQGPYDDAERIMATLRSARKDDFRFVIEVPALR